MRKIFLIFSVVCVGLTAWATPHRGSTIVMSAANRYAVQAGERIAELGGNTVDVAVTIALVMSVTNPSFASLGGGGFAMVKAKGKTEVLDFREVAPSKARSDYYLNKSKSASLYGGAAVGVPGIPAGLYELHKKYGKLHWSRLFDDAVRLAEKGFHVSGEWVEDLNEIAPNLNAAGKKYFFDKSGAALKPGDKLIQRQLARALKEMRNRKTASFYSGDVARDIVATVKNAGGDIALRDLENYRPVWRQPLKTTFVGFDVLVMPPPSSGGVVLTTAMKLAEKLKLNEKMPLSADEFHLLGQILNRAFRARTALGDPDHNKIDLAALVSDSTLKELAASIDSSKATAIAPLEAAATNGVEKTETTHLSVLDKNGDAVAMTITLNGSFGSGVVTEKYGITLNNEMDDFTTRPGEPNMFGLVQGEANRVAPGKRPLSSMSPTIVEKSGKTVMVLGAPGGPRIVSSVFQVLYRTLARGSSLEAAVLAPRVHQQFLPNTLYLEKANFPPEILEELADRKNQIEDGWMGRVYAAKLTDNVLEAVADTRGEGATAGF